MAARRRCSAADDESPLAAEIPRESVDPTDAFSEQTLELLQRAAEKAHERSELDSEHLLYALADTDVCAALLKELKLSPEDIKSYIDAHRIPARPIPMRRSTSCRSRRA